MKVIKVVSEEHGRLVSTFATEEWQKEYAERVETKPDVGYLFAFPSKNLKQARKEMSRSDQYWIAEAKVAGKVYSSDIDVLCFTWQSFWRECKLRLRVPRASYLLCSSITLVRRLQ